MAGALDGKIALITGASRGIGRATALRFAREGAHLILISKSKPGLEELDDELKEMGAQATLVPQDLTDFDAIDRIGGALYQRFGKLDILVGNAAMLGEITPLAHLQPQIWQQVMDLNVTANWRLIRAMEPLLKLSEAGRAIFLTSGTTRKPRPFWAAYAVSKAALENMVQNWVTELEKTPIKANLLDPGATRTMTRAKAYPGENPENVKQADALGDILVTLASTDCPHNGEVVRYDDL